MRKLELLTTLRLKLLALLLLFNVVTFNSINCLIIWISDYMSFFSEHLLGFFSVFKWRDEMEICSAGFWIFPFFSSCLLIIKSCFSTNILFGRYIFIWIYIFFLKIWISSIGKPIIRWWFFFNRWFFTVYREWN